VLWECGFIWRESGEQQSLSYKADGKKTCGDALACPPARSPARRHLRWRRRLLAGLKTAWNIYHIRLQSDRLKS